MSVSVFRCEDPKPEISLVLWVRTSTYQQISPNRVPKGQAIRVQHVGKLLEATGQRDTDSLYMTTLTWHGACESSTSFTTAGIRTEKRRFTMSERRSSWWELLPSRESGHREYAT
nr:hypothetical protein CFP56_16700 [Quercus suber]